MTKFATLTLLALIVVACAGTPQTPQQAVFLVKTDYQAALVVAVAYKHLPLCETGAPAICSQPKVVRQLQAASAAAGAILDGAETAARDGEPTATALLTAAQQAVAALSTLTQTLRTN